jgi:hypothetical protein
MSAVTLNITYYVHTYLSTPDSYSASVSQIKAKHKNKTPQVCGGTANVVDIFGTCCAGVLDYGGVCCESEIFDECGVCSGDGTTCSTQVES